MTAPPIAALIERHRLPLLQVDDLDFFLQPGRHNLLFLPGDPARYPEALDVAVVLPQLLQAFPGRLTAGLVAPEAERAVHARFGCRYWPALVLLRGDAYVGSIERMRDWDAYLAELADLLARAPSRPPGVGVTVATEGAEGLAAAGGCHG